MLAIMVGFDIIKYSIKPMEVL